MNLLVTINLVWSAEHLAGLRIWNHLLIAGFIQFPLLWNICTGFASPSGSESTRKIALSRDATMWRLSAAHVGSCQVPGDVTVRVLLLFLFWQHHVAFRILGP